MVQSHTILHVHGTAAVLSFAVLDQQCFSRQQSCFPDRAKSPPLAPAGLNRRVPAS